MNYKIVGALILIVSSFAMMDAFPWNGPIAFFGGVLLGQGIKEARRGKS